MGETPCKCPWLPSIEITSEKWDFGRFFSSWRRSRFAGEDVYGFFSKTFSGKYFFSIRNVFGKYFFAFENFPENVLTLEKKYSRIFFCNEFFYSHDLLHPKITGLVSACVESHAYRRKKFPPAFTKKRERLFNWLNKSPSPGTMSRQRPQRSLSFSAR